MKKQSVLLKTGGNGAEERRMLIRQQCETASNELASKKEKMTTTDYKPLIDGLDEWHELADLREAVENSTTVGEFDVKVLSADRWFVKTSAAEEPLILTVKSRNALLSEIDRKEPEGGFENAIAFERAMNNPHS